jgi:hypothetical protein
MSPIFWETPGMLAISPSEKWTESPSDPVAGCLSGDELSLSDSVDMTAGD